MREIELPAKPVDPVDHTFDSGYDGGTAHEKWDRRSVSALPGPVVGPTHSKEGQRA